MYIGQNKYSDGALDLHVAHKKSDHYKWWKDLQKWQMIINVCGTKSKVWDKKWPPTRLLLLIAIEVWQPQYKEF
jgi:hypothetical protein